MAGPLMYGIAQDPVAGAKVLAAFAKDNEKFVIKGGVMANALMSAKDVKTLATMPSREELLAKLVGTMQAPVVKFVRTLNEVPGKFVRTLAAVRDGPPGMNLLLGDPRIDEFFDLPDATKVRREGERTADIGQLRSTGSGGIGTGLVLTTGSNGIAQAAYEAPPRTDLTGNASILVQARPIGSDFEGQIYRTVRIELRSAEPRLFPQVPGNNVLPKCTFTVEPSVGPYRVNSTILFQTGASDEDGFIVRYEWFFGDGTHEDKPDTAKVYKFPGSFVVTHVVTDNVGGRSACAATFTVVP